MKNTAWFGKTPVEQSINRLERKISIELTQKIPLTLQSNGLPSEAWAKQQRRLRILKKRSRQLQNR